MRITLFAALLMLVLPLVASGQENNTQEKSQAPQVGEQQRRTEPLSVTIAEPIRIEGEKTVETNWGQPNCEKPQSHNEADLCQQRQMAKSAEDTVLLNKIQIAIGFVTLIGLAFTVFYTRSTAVGAASSNKIASDSAQWTHRARVAILDTQQFHYRDSRRIKVLFDLKNTGNFPATRIRTTLNFFAGPDWSPPTQDVLKIAPQDEAFGRVISSNETIHKELAGDDFASDAYAKAEAGGYYLRFGVVVVYLDGFENERTSWRWFEWDVERETYSECAARQD